MSSSRVLTPYLANQWASNDGKYLFEKVIKDGSFGTLLKAQRGKYGPRLAILLYHLPWNNGHIRGKKFQGLIGLHHKNIVEILECYECHDPPLPQSSTSSPGSPTFKPPPTAIAIVTNMCLSGSLDMYLGNYRINEETRLRWYKDLTQGLQYLHYNNILHWDISPANIWLQDDSLKIANVGFSKIAYESYGKQKINYGEFMSTCTKSSVPFLAPETFNDLYNFSSDIFSLALVFLVIADAPDNGCHKAVWGNDTEYLGQLLHMKEAPRSLAPVHLLDPPIYYARSQEVNLFNQMLRYDSHLRPDIDSVLECISLMKLGGTDSLSYRWLCSC